MAHYRRYPGEAGRYASETVREHPIALAMAGVGLGLLAYAAMRGFSDDDQYRRPDHPAYPNYGMDQNATTFGQPAGGPARNEAFGDAESFDTRGDLYPDIRGGSDGDHGRSRAAREYADKVSREARRRYEDARRRYDEARRELERSYSSAREGLRHGYRRARHVTEDALRDAGYQVREVGYSATRFVRDEPLMLAGAGLAVGALMGALLPMTRREHHAIGRESDAFRDRVKDAAREGYHRAEHVAEATYDAAREEARRQGFSSDGARSAAETVEKKAAAVYEAATDTARREAEKEASAMGSSSSSSTGSPGTTPSSTGSSSTGPSSTGPSSLPGSSGPTGSSGAGFSSTTGASTSSSSSGSTPTNGSPSTGNGSAKPI